MRIQLYVQLKVQAVHAVRGKKWYNVHYDYMMMIHWPCQETGIGTRVREWKNTSVNGIRDEHA